MTRHRCKSSFPCEITRSLPRFYNGADLVIHKVVNNSNFPEVSQVPLHEAHASIMSSRAVLVIVKYVECLEGVSRRI